MNTATNYIRLRKKYDEKQCKFLIEEAISGNLSIFIIDNRSNEYFMLKLADLIELLKLCTVANAKNKKGKGESYNFQAETKEITLENYVLNAKLAHFQKVGIDDLFGCPIKADKLLKDPLSLQNEQKQSLRQKNSLENIMAALLGTLLAKTQNGQPISFLNQSTLIDYLENNYSDLYGLSKRNLEKKFQAANQILKNRNNQP